MLDDQGDPQKCDCFVGLMAVVATAKNQVGAWCIWCGVGFGDHALLLLHPGQPMPGVEYLEVTVPMYPLLGKVNC